MPDPAKYEFTGKHSEAGNYILRHFHHEELCQLKVYMLSSSPKEHIVSPAIELRSAESGSTYPQFLSNFSVSP